MRPTRRLCRLSIACWGVRCSIIGSSVVSGRRIVGPGGSGRSFGPICTLKIFWITSAPLMACPNEQYPPSRFFVPSRDMQMKICDRSFVLLQGPVLDGQPTVMSVREPRCLAAAWEYWHRIMDSAYPVAEHPAFSARGLTVRQRQIVALLSADLNDDAIAAALGVSVRTVRGDIAEVMRIVGARSRFAAGVRFRDLVRQDDADSA